MKSNWSYLILGFLLTFALGSIVILGTRTYEPVKKEVAKTEETTATKTTKEKETTSAAAGSAKIFEKKNCISCHSISKLDLKGGTTGPDLSTAFKTVEGKHGKPIEEFLKSPSSAVMKGVIKDNPLSDKERQEVLKALKEASEK